MTLGAAAAIGAFSQTGDGGVRGPLLGFVYQRAAGIRPIFGISGAATLGAPVVPAENIRQAVLAPSEDFAILVLSGSGRVALVRNLSGAPDLEFLEVPADPAHVALSPDGETVALYYKDQARLEVLTGLPGAPALAWRWNFDAPPAELAAMAVAPAGRAVLVAAGEQPSPIWVISPEEGPRWIHLCEGAPKLAFLRHSDGAVIADTASGRLWLARDLSGEAAVEPIGGPEQAPSKLAAVAVGPDDRTIYVAAEDPAGVILLALGSQESMRIPCPCAPSRMERMAGGAAFRLTEGGAGSPVWILETAGSSPRIVFVPDAARLQRNTGRSPSPRRTGGLR
jgi:hypothetical protein